MNYINKSPHKHSSPQMCVCSVLCQPVPRPKYVPSWCVHAHRPNVLNTMPTPIDRSRLNMFKIFFSFEMFQLQGEIQHTASSVLFFSMKLTRFAEKSRLAASEGRRSRTQQHTPPPLRSPPTGIIAHINCAVLWRVLLFSPLQPSVFV